MEFEKRLSSNWKSSMGFLRKLAGLSWLDQSLETKAEFLLSPGYSGRIEAGIFQTFYSVQLNLLNEQLYFKKSAD